MAAPKGNKYWQLRKKHGKNPKYTPEELWEIFIDYCRWVDENPLKEAVLVQKGITEIDELGNKKTSYSTGIPKMRPYTLTGFYIFAELDKASFEGYGKKEDYISITTRIRNIIYTQKFEGAAAGLFNGNIIAKELGLIDKRENNIRIEQPLFGENFGKDNE